MDLRKQRTAASLGERQGSFSMDGRVKPGHDSLGLGLAGVFLLQLRKGHMAVAAMLLEIALVAFLGLPEGGGGLDLGDDGPGPFAGGFGLGLFLGGDAGLLRRRG